MTVAKRITVYTHTCQACGKSWESKDRKPYRCGKCRSPYWNVPRVREKKEVNRG